MWEINGILDQDPLSKFIVHIRVRIPSKKKTLECLKLTYILSCPSNGFWIEWDEVHHLWLNINHWFRNKLSQGESTLRPFRPLIIYSMILASWVLLTKHQSLILRWPSRPMDFFLAHLIRKLKWFFLYFKSVLFLFSLSLYYINLAKGVPLHLNVCVLKSSLPKDALCQFYWN